MCYFNHVWGNTYVPYLEKLFLMQEKIESFTVYDQELTKPLFEDAKISDVYQINKYLIGMFIYNVSNSNTLDIFKSMFICSSLINS